MNLYVKKKYFDELLESVQLDPEKKDLVVRKANQDSIDMDFINRNIKKYKDKLKELGYEISIEKYGLDWEVNIIKK